MKKSNQIIKTSPRLIQKSGWGFFKFWWDDFSKKKGETKVLEFRTQSTLFLDSTITFHLFILLVPDGFLCPDCIDNAGILDWTLLNLDFYNPVSNKTELFFIIKYLFQQGDNGRCPSTKVVKLNYVILGVKCCCGTN